MNNIEIIDAQILRLLNSKRTLHIDVINKKLKRKCQNGCDHRLSMLAADGLLYIDGEWDNGRFSPNGKWEITPKGEAVIQNYAEESKRTKKEKWIDRLIGGIVGLIVGLLVAYFTHIIQ